MRRLIVLVTLVAGLLWPVPSQAHGSCTLTALPPHLGFGKATVAIGRLVCIDAHRITVTTVLQRRVNGVWVMVDHTTERWTRPTTAGAVAAGEVCRRGKLYRTVASAIAGRPGAHPLRTTYSRGVRVC